jgi:hypothetical protein
MVPLAALFLMPPFFAMSVVVERWSFRKAVKCDSAMANRWAWTANLSTYGVIVVILAVLSVFTYVQAHG